MSFFLRADEVSPEQSWALLAWCVAHGGTELFLRQMSLVGEPEPNLDHVNAQLAPFRLPPAVRERTVVYDGHPDSELSDLWALTPESITVLRRLLPDGLFAPPSYDEGGWLEEPTIYRGGALLLGVVSHEGYGIIECAPAELVDLQARGIPVRTSPI